MAILRTCSGALATAIQNGATDRGSTADLFTITLLSGTIYRWTSSPIPLVSGGNAFASGTVNGTPWLSRSRCNWVNTMEVGTLEIFIDTTALAGFAGGPTLLAQIQSGLFDGATVFLQRVFLPSAGDTTTWGTIDLFLGDAGAASLTAPRATIKVRGKNSRLDVMMPRNLYQPSCNHTFCDPGCTLSAAAHTFAHVVTAGSTRSVVNWSGSALALFAGGTVTMTSGVANGQVKGIIAMTSTTLTLVTPLIAAPIAGDTFTAFQACDKTMTRCSVFSNLVNYRGTPFVPPPDTTGPV